MKTVAKADRKHVEELEQFGVSLDMIRAEKREPRLLLCAIRGLLIFMATFGTLGGLVSAFGLEFRFYYVMTVIFAISMFIALIYYNKVTFYVGYVLLLAGFAYFSAKSFWYINSGYQAFLNVSGKAYNNYFHLSAVRESTEVITDRNLTVSAVMIFLGALLALLLNISISAYMSLLLTFLITFLPLQVAYYINRPVPLPYLMMLLAVYITVMVLKRSGNFALPSKYGKEHRFETKYRKKSVTHKYLVSGSGMIVITVYSIVLASVFLFAINGALERSADADNITNTVKAKTDEYVKTVAQGGLSALFNRYDSTGGLSRGRLGGVGSVNPDFETDLIVRFVPYGTDSLFLRSYVGKYYEEDRFWPGFGRGDNYSGHMDHVTSSGKMIYGVGWQDDEYYPTLPKGNVAKPGSQSSSETQPDNSESQSGDGTEPDSTESQSFEGNIGVRISSLTVDSDSENTKTSITIDMSSTNGTSSQSPDSSDPDNTDYPDSRKFAKIWIGNVGADTTGDYAPYYSFQSTKIRSEINMAFPSEWSLLPQVSLQNSIPEQEGVTISVEELYEILESIGFTGRIDLDDSDSVVIFQSSPYHSVFTPNAEMFDTKEEMIGFGGEDLIENYELLFIPYSSAVSYEPNVSVSSEYEGYVYENYLQVPEEMKDTLAGIAAEARLTELARGVEIIKNRYDRFSFYSAVMNIETLTNDDKGTILRMINQKMKSAIFGMLPDEEKVESVRAYAASLRDVAAGESRNYFKNSANINNITADLVEDNAERFISGATSDAARLYSEEDYERLQQLRLQILSRLRLFYRHEFSYTMSPGRTPSGKDTIEYFLTKRRRGYCVHFASSACLILRSLGIPTRYVEGYVIHNSDIAQGKVVDTDLSKWKYGDYGYGESAVIETEITDGSAHAWIEVYIDGYGWIPYEMTPPSDDDLADTGIFGLLSGFFTGRRNRTETRDTGDNVGTGENGDAGTDTASTDSLSMGINFLLIPLFWLAGLFIAVVLLIFAIRYILYFIKLRRLEKAGSYSEALLLVYRRFLKTMRKKKLITAPNPTVAEAFDEIRANTGAADNESPETADTNGAASDQTTTLVSLINHAAFSNDALTFDQYSKLREMLKKLTHSKRKAGA